MQYQEDMVYSKGKKGGIESLPVKQVTLSCFSSYTKQMQRKLSEKLSVTLFEQRRGKQFQ